MSDRHPGPELLTRFLNDDLTPRERRQVVRHLLSGCARCVKTTRPLWKAGAGGGPAGPEAAGSVLHPASYNGVFERVLEAGRQREEELAAERREAPLLAAQLLKYPRGRRLAQLCRDRRFHTTGLCQLLLARSRAVVRDEPGAAVELAELALAVAERLDAGHCGRAVAQSSCARAWAYLGDARRLAGDLAGADRALRVARSLLPEIPSDPLEQPEILALAAGLAADQGHYAQADRLLDRVIAAYSALEDQPLVGRALLQRGLTAARAGRRVNAIRLLREGLSRLEATGDLRRLACAFHALTELLQREGRWGEALLCLQRLRPLYGRLGDRANLVRLRWLEGRVEQELDRPEVAATAFREARAGFLGEGLGREAALASLDLAALAARQDNWTEVRQVADTLFPVFRAGDLRRGAVATLLVFQRAVAADHASPELLAELAGFLQGACGDACRSWAA
jgi:tetratricopeptide (TPR) repeat protein